MENNLQRNKDNLKEIILNLNLDKILLPLDGSLESEISIPYAAMLSRWFSGEIMLLHVLPENPIAAVERSGNVSYPDEQHDRGEILAKSYLEAIIDTIAPQGIKARWGISTGSESEMIISRTESNSIGVIAIATKLKSKIRRVFFNNLLNELFRKTNVPVLVINTDNIDVKILKPSPPKVIISQVNKSISDENINRIIAICVGSKAKLIFISKKNKKSENFLPSKLMNLVEKNEIEYEINYEINKINKLSDDFWTISTLSKYSGINRIIHDSFSFETLKKSKTPTIILPN